MNKFYSDRVYVIVIVYIFLKLFCFIFIFQTDNKGLDGQKHQLNKLNGKMKYNIITIIDLICIFYF